MFRDFLSFSLTPTYALSLQKYETTELKLLNFAFMMTMMRRMIIIHSQPCSGLLRHILLLRARWMMAELLLAVVVMMAELRLGELLLRAFTSLTLHTPKTYAFNSSGCLVTGIFLPSNVTENLICLNSSNTPRKITGRVHA